MSFAPHTTLPITLLYALGCMLSISGCSAIVSATHKQPLQDDPARRSWGRMLDDETIETKARVNIGKADERLKEAHIVVVSVNGNVLITGQVASQGLSRKAEKTVRELRYVRKVHNDLSVAPMTSLSERSSDTWITTKIKSKMLFSTKVDPAEVKVVTEAGTVYLLGLVDQTSADKAVDMARYTSGVQKVVRMFEYIE